MNRLQSQGEIMSRDIEEITNLQGTVLRQASDITKYKLRIQDLVARVEKMQLQIGEMQKQLENPHIRSFPADELAERMEGFFKTGVLPLPKIDQKGLATVTVDPKDFSFASTRSGALLRCSVRFGFGQGYQTEPIDIFFKPVPNPDDHNSNTLWPGYSSPTWAKKVSPKPRRKRVSVTKSLPDVPAGK